MKSFLFFAFFSVCILSIAEVTLPLRGSSLFSIEDLPSEGKMEFKIGQQTENIEFGKDKPQYGLGIIFAQKNLPESFNKGLGKLQMIQIAIGNRGNQTPDSISQFGSFMIRTDRIPNNTALKLPFLDSVKADKEPTPAAFVVFNSPQLKLGIDDQEKLKNTFFSEKGELTLIPTGSVESTTVRKEGYKRLSFKRQMMELVVDAQLGTPFSSEKGSIKGNMKFPLYWPGSEEADNFVSELAKESLERHPEIAPASEVTRSLASPHEPSHKEKITK